MMKIIIRLIDYILLMFSYLVPRRKTLWAFGSSSGYADNAKYLYQEVCSCHPEIEAVWMTRKSEVKQLRNLGVNALDRKSVKGLLTALRAKVFIYSAYTFDISYPMSGGAFKFNLWHGVPMKEIEFLISGGPLRKAFDSSLKSKFLYPFYYQRPDLLLAVGQRNSELFRKAFRVDDAHSISNIYPRCKLFLKDKQSQIEFLKKEDRILSRLYEKTKIYDKVYIYMPTFRDSHPCFLQEAGFDFSKLNDVLRESNSYFILKAHPTTTAYLQDLKDYSNIYVVRQWMDAYPLLPFVDVLITDYSSIYFDYLYLKKEIILFPFDKDRYAAEDRPFVIDYDIDIKGARVYLFLDLLSLIKNKVDCHLQADDYDEMIEMYASNNNIDLAEYIKEKIKFN